MQVLLLDLGLELRGGQRQVYYLAQELQHSDVVPFIACPKASALAVVCKKERIPFIPLLGRSPANPLILCQLEKALRKLSINIIHTNDAHSAALGAFSKALHGNNILLMHSRRVSYPLHTGSRMKKYLLADSIVTVSEEIRKRVIQSGIEPNKVSTIHSCIDPSLYYPKKDRKDGRFVFQSIGALTSQKGYSNLLQAMHIIKKAKDLPPWEVRIAGSGELFQSLLNEAFELNVASQLALLGQQDSRVILPLADAVVVPSVEGEGSNATIKEGWATGIPVIASNLESNAELIQDEINGLLVPVNDPVALAMAMIRCMQEPRLCEKIVSEGTKSLENFTTTTMVKQYLQLYRNLFPMRTIPQQQKAS